MRWALGSPRFTEHFLCCGLVNDDATYPSIKHTIKTCPIATACVKHSTPEADSSEANAGERGFAMPWEEGTLKKNTPVISRISAKLHTMLRERTGREETQTDTLPQSSPALHLAHRGHLSTKHLILNLPSRANTVRRSASLRCVGCSLEEK